MMCLQNAILKRSNPGVGLGCRSTIRCSTLSRTIQYVIPQPWESGKFETTDIQLRLFPIFTAKTQISLFSCLGWFILIQFTPWTK